MSVVQQNGWSKCPKGELDRLASRLQSRRRRRARNEMVATVLAAGAIGLSGAALLGLFDGVRTPQRRCRPIAVPAPTCAPAQP
jgi:hypothetical protein